MLTQEKEYTFPSPGEEELKYPPVIVGSGPAGIFLCLVSGEGRLSPPGFGTGEEAHVRQKTVENLLEKWRTGSGFQCADLVKGVLVLFPTEN